MQKRRWKGYIRFEKIEIRHTKFTKIFTNFKGKVIPTYAKLCHKKEQIILL